MDIDFDALVPRRGRGSLKWDHYADPAVLPMWVADMDFPAAPSILRALEAEVEHGVFGYAVPRPSVTETVLAMLAARHGWEIDPAWLVWLPGLVTGLNVACRAVGEPGAEVMSMVPIYPPFLSAPRCSQRQSVAVPMTVVDGRYGVDFERLEAAITPRMRLLLLCNPHNPTGRVFTAAELGQLAELCLRHGLCVCSDEIHCGLVLDADRRHLSIATVSQELAARSITLLSPSKTYNLAGLGCAFAVIPDAQLRHRCQRVMFGLVPHVGPLGYVACEAAYRDAEPWRQALLAYLRGNRDLVEQAVAAMPGLSMHHVEATYLAWIDCREAGLRDPQAAFEAGGVGLSQGADFGEPGFLRLNFGCSRRLLNEALDRMRTVLSTAACR